MTTRQLMNTVHGGDVLEDAARIVDELNDWLNDCDNMGWVPTATMFYGGGYLSISIGEDLVWDTEGQAADAMTLTATISQWKLRFHEMKPFIEKHEAFMKSLP